MKLTIANSRLLGNKNSSISANVRLRGNIQIGEYSSIAQNSSLSGAKAGIIIKNNVMIAPNCVLVAFDHGFRTRAIPMLYQEFLEEKIIIEDDVWIGANCVITKGAHIKKGAIVAANSVVIGTVDSYAIYGGSPAKLIKYRPD